MKLSIIIVHYKTPAFLKSCLKSIEQSKLKIEFEVLVVDSDAMREAKDICEDFEKTINIKYVPFNYNTGFAKGVNSGLSQSQGEFILILNPDIVVAESSIEKMILFMEKHQDIGIMGPRLKNYNGSHQQNYFRFYTFLTLLARRTPLGRLSFMKNKLNKFMMTDTSYEDVQTPDWLMGAALMTHKNAVQKVGFMDKNFFMYFEDVDWCRRFWHNGYKVVYYPDAFFYHYYMRESKSRFILFDIIFNKATRWHIASAIKFFWKYRNFTKLPYLKNKHA